jgi:ElaB/YqjD/DUF883 family membrane-anchored ribosome-binding protein
MPHTRDHATEEQNMTQLSDYTPASDSRYGREYGDGAAQTAQGVKDKAKDVGEKAQEKADAGMDKAAEGMQSAAEQVREKAQARGGMTAEAGTKVADTVERGAEYLRDHDSQQLMDDLERFVRDHPMQAVAGAVVGGFILGRLLG